MSTVRHSLVEDVTDDLLDKVVSGAFAVGEPLPPEAEISERMGVSRLTTREAIKALQAQNILYVRRGVGTFVNPPEKWTSLTAVLRSLSSGLEPAEVALKLLEARRIVETGAAELAAERHGEADLERMRATIEAMVDARRGGDVPAFTAADIAFHDAVLAASGNPFVPALLGGLSPLLYRTRSETSAFAEIQDHAIEQHERLLAAVASGDPALSREAMQAHINQTYADYETYLSIR